MFYLYRQFCINELEMAMSSHGGKRLLTVVLDFASFNLYMKTNSTLRSYFQAYTYLGKHSGYFILIIHLYVQFISYSKCSNWRWISKLLSIVDLLFAILLGQIKSKLNYKLVTYKLAVDKLHVCKSVLIEFAPTISIFNAN